MDRMFYYISTNHKLNICTLSLEDNQLYDSWAVFRGEEIPKSLLKFHHIMGRKPKDIIMATDAVLQIVSDRFLKILSENDVTGWSTFPVIVYDKNGNELTGYSGFSVVGRSGPIDDTKHRVEYRTSPFNPDYRYKVGIGLYFDIDTWDGSDIFTPQGGIIIVVERVKVLLENAKFKELIFTSINDYEIDLIE